MVSILLVIYKSERRLLNSFIRRINGKFNLIIIDNSGNYDFSKIALPKKAKIIRSSNKGYGAALNLGLKYCKTKYAIISNIDVIFKKNFVLDFLLIAKRVKKFAILIPNHKNKNYRSELIENYEGEGATMLVNVKKINKLKFDENFFLYYEDTDLVKRFLDKKQNIYQVPINYSNFFGSHNKLFSTTIEINRNWHYMWSKFYYRRKHFGYLYALISTLPYFIRSLLKLIINVNKIEEKNKYFARLSGLYNSYILKKSWYRPKI